MPISHCPLPEVRTVSAFSQGRPLAFSLEPGDSSLHEQLDAAVELTSLATGEPVEMVGMDRGGLSQSLPWT